MEIGDQLDGLWLDDLDPSGGEATGLAVYGQDIWHMITSERGSVIGSPDKGTSLYTFIHNDIDDSAIARLRVALVNEIQNDERTESVTVEITQTGYRAVNIYVQSTSVDGDVSFIVGVNDVTVELLSLNYGGES